MNVGKMLRKAQFAQFGRKRKRRRRRRGRWSMRRRIPGRR